METLAAVAEREGVKLGRDDEEMAPPLRVSRPRRLAPSPPDWETAGGWGVLS